VNTEFVGWNNRNGVDNDTGSKATSGYCTEIENQLEGGMNLSDCVLNTEKLKVKILQFFFSCFLTITGAKIQNIGHVTSFGWITSVRSGKEQ
jgi:hypothetical protein